MDDTDTTWFDREVSGCHLADERLKKRLCDLLGRIGGAVGNHSQSLSGLGAHQGGISVFFERSGE